MKRLQQFTRLCLVVPSADASRSAWARSVVDEDSWIQWEGTHADADAATLAVDKWREESQLQIHGVMTYDEFAVELVSAIGEKLGLPCTPLEHVRAFRNKDVFREKCRVAGVPAAGYARIRTQADLESALSGHMRFPCVLKPAKGAGSWHIMKVDSADEVRTIFVSLQEQMDAGTFPKDICEAGFILEEYFEGDEVDVDGWACNGRLEFFVVNDNRPAIEPYFVELGGFYPSQLKPEAVAALENLTRQVVAAFPGMHTCFHFEAKINSKSLEVMPIELNSRCGGAECPACVEAISGYYLPEVAARLACGLEVTPREQKYKVVASTNVHVWDVGTVKECTDVDVDVEATKLVTSVLTGTLGARHTPGLGSRSCLGWMACGGADAEEAECNLQKAVAQARITVVKDDEGDLEQPSEAKKPRLST